MSRIRLGKTTLLKSISARLTPQQGDSLRNRSLYAMSEADRRRRCAPNGA
ncbi:hypothetical protein N5T07_11910 [Escherichia coli]|nr:hypothetical protein [Escherichia coli]MCW3270556.1 hypothetical protein [Escherichia coli]